LIVLFGVFHEVFSFVLAERGYIVVLDLFVHFFCFFLFVDIRVLSSGHLAGLIIGKGFELLCN
jgi:hypothetical protein